MENIDLRRKYELLEESWSKKEEDAAPVAPAPIGGTTTADIALVKRRLGEDENADNEELSQFSIALEGFLSEKTDSFDDDSKQMFFDKALELLQSKKPVVSGEPEVKIGDSSDISGNFAEEFHHKEKKDFPPSEKEKSESTGSEQAERQLKLDQSIEQPADEVLGKPEKKKKEVKKEEVDRRYFK